MSTRVLNTYIYADVIIYFCYLYFSVVTVLHHALINCIQGALSKSQDDQRDKTGIKYHSC